MSQKRSGKGASNGTSNGSSSPKIAEVDNGPEVITTLEDKLKENFDLLSEKRYTTREGAIAKLVELLSENYEHDFVSSRIDTLQSSCIRGITRGTNNEQKLALKLLGVVAITLGAEQNVFFQSVAPTLKEKVKFAEEMEIRQLAASTLAIVCFVSVSNAPITEEIIHFFEEFFEEETAPVHENIIQGWSLLLTAVPATEVRDTIFPTFSEKIVFYLRDDSLLIKQAAGEALALLVEIMRDIHTEEAGEDEEFDLHDYDYFDVEDTMSLLDDLRNETSKNTSKKELSKQRNIFKEIYNSIESQEVPKESLVFKHQKITFETWSDLIKLDSFRNALGTGLQAHFVRNDLLHDTFEVYIDKAFKKGAMTSLDKRLYMSPNSAAAKQRSKNKSANRNVRSAAATHSYDSYEGYDD